MAALAARGHEVRSLSRSGPVPVDLRDGSGLDAALDGVEAVIDAANAGPAKAAARAVLVDGNRRLLAAEARASVAHHVADSIIGIDRVRAGYHAVELEQEAVVRDGVVPWTIVRATRSMACSTRPSPRPRASACSPAARCRCSRSTRARLRRWSPTPSTPNRGGRSPGSRGPRWSSSASWRGCGATRAGRRALVTPVPTALLGRVGRELAAGALTDPSAWRGRTGFAAWLRDGGAPVASPEAPVGSAPR